MNTSFFFFLWFVLFFIFVFVFVLLFGVVFSRSYLFSRNESSIYLFGFYLFKTLFLSCFRILASSSWRSSSYVDALHLVTFQVPIGSLASHVSFTNSSLYSKKQRAQIREMISDRGVLISITFSTKASLYSFCQLFGESTTWMCMK